MRTEARGTLLDIAKGGAATAALFAAYLNIPLVGTIAGVFVPFPALYYDLKRGRGAGVALVALSAILATLMGGPSAAVFYLLQAGSLSISLPFFLARGQSTGRAIASAVLVAGMVIAVAVLGYGIARDVDIHSQVGAAIKSSIAQSITFYEKSGIKGEELQLVKEGMVRGGEMLAQLYPALLILGETLVAGLNLLLLRRLSARLALNLPEAHFNRFRNPDYLVWGLIAAGFALLVENGVVTVVALNVLIIAGFLYFMQGMAIVSHFFKAYAVPSLLRYLFYILLVVQAYLAIAVALLGLFDLWADFRRPRPRKNL